MTAGGQILIGKFARGLPWLRAARNRRPRQGKYHYPRSIAVATHSVRRSRALKGGGGIIRPFFGKHAATSTS